MSIVIYCFLQKIVSRLKSITYRRQGYEFLIKRKTGTVFAVPGLPVLIKYPRLELKIHVLKYQYLTQYANL